MPWDEVEIYGHSDGIVRHISDKKVLFTNYKDFDEKIANEMKNRISKRFAPLLSSFNMMGGGVPINVTANNSQAIGEEMLAQAIAKGFMMAPPPVLSVEEFTSVANRTRYVENLGDI